MLCGLVAPLFFIAGFSVQGIFKAGYSALRFPISSLSIGETGWMQTATFIISGLLLLLFAVGVKQQLDNRLPAVLFALVAVGLIASGIFSTDPVYGFPQNLPFKTKVFTTHGKLHTLFSLLVFINIPVTCFVMTRHFSRQKEAQWQYYSLITGIMMLVLFLFTGLAFEDVFGMAKIGGLLQRLCVITGFIWISLLAHHLKTSHSMHRQ